MANMKMAIFAKQRTTVDENGKPKIFYTYLSTLVKKSTGEVIPIQVKFREKCGAPDPDTCPCYINVAKENANLTYEEYEVEETGETREAAKMWVTDWTPAGAYVDHSLDDFDAFDTI